MGLTCKMFTKFPVERLNYSTGVNLNLLHLFLGESRRKSCTIRILRSANRNCLFISLAVPGMWWRATAIALVMCGASPDTIGARCWQEHPTLRTLIKMVISDRYRFPTVDCDDPAREEMKRTEQSMRDEVRIILSFVLCVPTGYRNSSFCSGSARGRASVSSQKGEEEVKN